MEVTFPESRCELSPNHAHHFRPVMDSIWRCNYCWAPKWTPFYWSYAVQFSNDIARMGLAIAYQKHLHHKPKTRLILEKLEEIRLLRKAGLAEDVLMKAIAAVVVDNEPRPEPVPVPEPYVQIVERRKRIIPSPTRKKKKPSTFVFRNGKYLGERS